jgi:crossover junction endodeoxyribonuclease RusA
LVVDVIVHPPDRRRRDVDNCLKSLLDALQHGGAYQDDSQIVRLSIEKRKPIKGGLTIVQIQEVTS